MKFLLSLFAAASLLGMIATPAKACQFDVYDDTPSTETKTIRHRAGFTFEAPMNYRAELGQGGTIELLDPDSAQMLDCIRRENIAMGGWGTVTVRHSPAIVRGPMWPYDVEHLPSNARFLYFEDGSAVIAWYSEYHNSGVGRYFENLPNGNGSVEITYYGEYDHHLDLFATIERSLEFE